MMAINFTGYALCKINKENYDLWGTKADKKMVYPATLVGFAPLLHDCPYTPTGVRSYYWDNSKKEHECSWSLLPAACTVEREQLQCRQNGSNLIYTKLNCSLKAATLPNIKQSAIMYNKFYKCVLIFSFQKSSTAVLKLDLSLFWEPQCSHWL